MSLAALPVEVITYDGGSVTKQEKIEAAETQEPKVALSLDDGSQ